MNTLIVDTSGDMLFASLGTSGGAVLAETGVKMKSNINENLLKTVDFLLESSGTSLSEIENFYTITGPGSFTGIRIGVSTMLGLASSMGKKLKGISSLDAYALVCGEESVEVWAKLRLKSFVRKSYDFKNMVFSEYETVKLDDEESITHIVNREQKSSLNLTHSVKNIHFTKFGCGYEPLYFRKSEAEINFDQRRACG
ncbi:tRNA (adenosine(37)-N6)-threonylcarbamoyltransferase complex dimerization subunit type 1 TsaB [Geovibrio thiophilus]|uniref:tRNA (Adenosine(37)-N6)-threonylcarbamoyltransferase complex dimerization subunit type 1 TsaB n=1 Tax=Geovibrio thiophilus TaxID=139438 RepID=A0A410JYK4_9BACT|nr:tRNA (adenosine(37)-N6)-threonylcarbamoyltransferase complex dimerization subunit type 1 TsaB [Geovibrio thiophilus]QAR33257.1 tRNA (adenosine(37)-N6)-threonylcarbamoyltransferase complex dimerization subunit type 1 TsaB [Geovibrio thiophilus]